MDQCNISVVIQGPVYQKITQECIASVQRVLPGAEVILSTWVGSNTEGLTCDKIVTSEDPSGFKYKGLTFTNNLARMLKSTQSGLQAATKRYTLKLRSDVKLLSKDFLNAQSKFPERCKENCIFSERVVCSNYFF